MNNFFKEGYIIKCIICSEEIKLLSDTNLLHQAMWHNGIVDKIAAPFGSIFDGNMYIIGICDKCIKEKEDKLIYVGDYLMTDKDPDLYKVLQPYKEEIIKSSIKRKIEDKKLFNKTKKKQHYLNKIKKK